VPWSKSIESDVSEAETRLDAGWNWSPEEVDPIVADYHEMVRGVLVGKNGNKAKYQHYSRQGSDPQFEDQ
jgi:hypothetical protein